MMIDLPKEHFFPLNAKAAPCVPELDKAYLATDKPVLDLKSK
jgi:hypothetical protein